MTDHETHVLLVDDDQFLRRYIAQALEKIGLKVLHANCYAVAMELLTTHDIRVGIIDLALPDRSGIELLQQIRSLPQYAQLPIIVQSGFGDRHLPELLACLPIAILQKPFPLDDLKYHVKEALTRVR